MATTEQSTSVMTPWGLGDALIGFCIGTVLQFLVASAIGLGKNPSVQQEFLLEIPLWGAFLLTPIWATRTRGSGPVADLHLAVRPIDALGLVVGGLAQVVVGWAYLPFVSNHDLEKPAKQLAHSAHGGGGKLVLVLLTCVFAPVLEEFFYRGLILRAVRRRLPDWAAVLSVALLFAAMHFEPLQLPGLFVFGAIAGALAIKTDRLGPAMAAHIGFNIVALWQLHIF